MRGLKPLLRTLIILKYLYTQERHSIKSPTIKSKVAKKYKTALGAIPQFEHLYIDNDFRLVKTRREAKQRASNGFLHYCGKS